MKFSDPIVHGSFIKRYKRFFVDFEKDGQTFVAHIPNTGSMKGCASPGAPCILTTNDDPKRKLKYTLQMIKSPHSWVGVNTGLANKLAMEAVSNHMLEHWKPYDRFQSEVKVSHKSRLDLALWKSSHDPSNKIKTPQVMNHPRHFIEVKNVTMAEGRAAQFPDAETTRGQKHLQELMHLIDQGHTAELLFIIQRSDIDYFEPADEIDPVYADLLRLAKEKGVIITAIKCELGEEGITLAKNSSIEIRL